VRAALLAVEERRQARRQAREDDRAKLVEAKVAAKVAAEAVRRFRRRLRVYNVTEETFEKLYTVQSGRCGICQRALSYGECVIDHDHRCCGSLRSCGRCVRGLLCADCNRGLGDFSDDPERLRGAIAYLDRFAQMDCNTF
jgi:hypothetical protein